MEAADMQLPVIDYPLGGIFGQPQVEIRHPI
jgi:hypothetical protein